MSAIIFEREAPAKVNLSLRILGKRADGFHELETTMVRISLSDSIRCEAGEPGSGLLFTCDDPTLPTDESNLVVKAVRGVEQVLGRSLDLGIHLNKRVPHGAGLGGGSSDAASVLLGLDAGLGLGLGREILTGIAASLGSDIPFFLYEGACFCRGRGEIVEPLSEFPWRPRLILVKPAFSVPTPWAYKEWLNSKELPGIDYESRAMPWGELVNSLERPVLQSTSSWPTSNAFWRNSLEWKGRCSQGAVRWCLRCSEPDPTQKRSGRRLRTSMGKRPGPARRLFCPDPSRLPGTCLPCVVW